MHRVAAVLTTQGGTRGHEPGARRNDVSSMVCLACRGEVIIDNRQSNTNAEPCRETCASASFGSSVLQGVADTTSTKFFFPKKIQTTRDDDPRMNMCWISTEGTDSTCSTNHDTGTAAPPKCIQSRARERCPHVIVSQPGLHPIHGRTCSTSFHDKLNQWNFTCYPTCPFVLDGPDIGLQRFSCFVWLQHVVQRPRPA